MSLPVPHNLFHNTGFTRKTGPEAKLFYSFSLLVIQTLGVVSFISHKEILKSIPVNARVHHNKT